MQRLVELSSVPAFADWCAFDVQESDGTIRRLAVQHADPARLELARELFHHHPPCLTDSRGITKVLETGRSDWSPARPEAMGAGEGRDAEHLESCGGSDSRSYICTPIVIQHMRAVLSFVTAESGRGCARHRPRGGRRSCAPRRDRHREREPASSASGGRHSQGRVPGDARPRAAQSARPDPQCGADLQLPRPTETRAKWARDVIERQVDPDDRLVDDLLDVSRITQGKIELRRERLELARRSAAAVEAAGR